MATLPILTLVLKGRFTSAQLPHGVWSGLYVKILELSPEAPFWYRIHFLYFGFTVSTTVLLVLNMSMPNMNW
jgi:hypothetical protein